MWIRLSTVPGDDERADRRREPRVQVGQADLGEEAGRSVAGAVVRSAAIAASTSVSVVVMRSSPAFAPLGGFEGSPRTGQPSAGL